MDHGPIAALARQPKAPRSRRLDGAGEAQLLQRAQSAPPAGQARGTLRALARELVARGMASRIRYETVRRVLKKELTPWRRVQRCYPPVPPEADFVIRMEAVLDRYSRPYDARCPVICRDEHAQFLRADKWPSHPARPGHPATYDYEYVRCGACTIWMFVEPLGPWRTARVTARRTAVDWAHQVKALADHPRYRHAERLIRVCDNLNTHTYRSFFRAFPRAEAERLVRRVCLVFTPRHGRWLHRAEPELSVLTRQALSPRRPTRRGPRASHRMGGGPPRGPKGHQLAVPHRRRPRAPQTSVSFNRNMIKY